MVSLVSEQDRRWDYGCWGSESSCSTFQNVNGDWVSPSSGYWYVVGVSFEYIETEGEFLLQTYLQYIRSHVSVVVSHCRAGHYVVARFLDNAGGRTVIWPSQALTGSGWLFGVVELFELYWFHRSYRLVTAPSSQIIVRYEGFGVPGPIVGLLVHYWARPVFKQLFFCLVVLKSILSFFVGPMLPPDLVDSFLLEANVACVV